MSEKIPYWQSSKCALKKRWVKPKYFHVTEDDIKTMVSMYESGEHTYKSIATFFNRHPSSVGDILNKRGFEAKDASLLARKYNINEYYFEEINTEQKAYFLGFMYADGNNSVNNYELSMGLQPEDGYILDRFLKEMDSEHSVKSKTVFNKGKNREYLSISIGSRRLSLDLERHGCMQKKSFKIRLPETVPDNLIHHFFRGYFDGDGSFSISKSIRSNMIFTITSNKIFLKSLQDLLVTKLGLNETKISTASNSHDDIGVLVYGGRGNCIKIRDWMYKGATVYLQRKFDKLHSI